MWPNPVTKWYNILKSRIKKDSYEKNHWFTPICTNLEIRFTAPARWQLISYLFY